MDVSRPFFHRNTKRTRIEEYISTVPPSSETSHISLDIRMEHFGNISFQPKAAHTQSFSGFNVQENTICLTQSDWSDPRTPEEETKNTART